MSEPTKTFVPNLRFPEFREAPAWRADLLKNISPSIFDGTHQTPRYTENGIPFFSVENIISGNKNKFISLEDHKAATSKNKPEQGDILITRIGNIGFSTIINWDYEFSIYVTLALIKKSDKFIPYYLHSYFQSGRYQSEILKKSLLNAVPCKINMDELRTTEVLLPTEKIEQQKIADCLSSIDELITAQTKKIAALKTHKKGLMQQLFPTEGETVPKLRFPEFQDADEWEQRPLSKVGEIITGKTPSTTDQTLWNGNIQFVTPTDITEEKYQLKTQRSVVGNDIKAIPKNSTMFTCIASIGKMSLSVSPCITNQQINTVIPNEDYANEFVYYSLLSMVPKIKATQANTTLPIINKTEFSKFTIAIPPIYEEQQKIANCLSSLDELITAQTHKLVNLKAHKKGLMQQLFPNADEDGE